MSKKTKGRKQQSNARRQRSSPAHTMAWQEGDGTHFMMPGTPPTPEMLEEMTKAYQRQIRNSPLWDEMVKQYGLHKAEEILEQCRAELR